MKRLLIGLFVAGGLIAAGGWFAKTYVDAFEVRIRFKDAPEVYDWGLGDDMGRERGHAITAPPRPNVPHKPAPFRPVTDGEP